MYILTKTFVAGQGELDKNTTCAYDCFSRLITHNQGKGASYYTYNPQGLRASKRVPNKTLADKTEYYAYDGNNVLLEIDEAGNQLAANTWGHKLVCRQAAAETMFYWYNGHGDVVALLDPYGAVLGMYAYDAFGVPVTCTDGHNNPYRYAGYTYDQESGLYYLRTRFYQAEIGRFIQRDSYAGAEQDPLSLNRYTYCENEPVMYADPVGQAKIPVSKRDVEMMMKGYIPIRVWTDNIGAKVVSYNNKTKRATIKFKNGDQWVMQGLINGDTMYIDKLHPEKYRKEIYGTGGLLNASTAGLQRKPAVNSQTALQIMNSVPVLDHFSKNEEYIGAYISERGGNVLSFNNKNKTATVKIGNETIVFKGRIGVNNRMIIDPTDPSQIVSRSQQLVQNNNTYTATDGLVSGTTALTTGFVDTVHSAAFKMATERMAGTAVKVGSKASGAFSYIWSMGSDLYYYEGKDLAKAWGVSIASNAAVAPESLVVGTLAAPKFGAKGYIFSFMAFSIGNGMLADAWKKENLTSKR